MAHDPHELADNLWIGFAIESMIFRAGRTEDIDEGAMDRATPRPIAPEQRTIDVEQDETPFAFGAGHDRVSTRPEMIEIVPAICHAVIPSPNANHATMTAKIGWRLEYMAVRVG